MADTVNTKLIKVGKNALTEQNGFHQRYYPAKVIKYTKTMATVECDGKVYNRKIKCGNQIGIGQYNMMTVYLEIEYNQNKHIDEVYDGYY